MLSPAQISEAFYQYLTDFDMQLRDDPGDYISAPNILDALDSSLTRFSEAFELNTVERAALILGVVGELYPLELQKFVGMHYADGMALLPLGTINIHLVVLLFGDDPLLFSSESPLLHLRILRSANMETKVGGRLRPLVIDPDVVRFLLGDMQWPTALSAYVSELPDAIGVPDTEQQEILVKHLSGGEHQVAQLFGRDLSEQYDLALATLAELEKPVTVLKLGLLLGAVNLSDDLPLLERESRIADHAFVLEAHFGILDVSEEEWPAEKLEGFVANLIGHLHGPLLILCQEPLQLGVQRPSLLVEVPHLSRAQQRALWAEQLQLKSPDVAKLKELTDQFDLTGNGIVERARVATQNLPVRASEAQKLERVWEACRLSGRQRLGKLAERMTGQPTWEDLILPPDDLVVLEQIVQHVRHRTKVYEEWGMGTHQRGLGITALFSGPSGTGKTLASEVVANALKLDLYRVDVSSMVSKYIGETEKNLKKIFDAADEGGVILLFDEADSLFGKRGDVQSSNDRFANTQVNYLLQRMESYQGLALLTTNLESSMDAAFMRRLRFTLNFRNPEIPERERIWRRAFPKQVDVSGLNFQQLASVPLAGGNIRSVALNAAFMAAAQDEQLSMPMLRQAIRGEWRKLGRVSLDDSAFQGWT